jgi:serine/arginine repetitive matrix protein 2
LEVEVIHVLYRSAPRDPSEALASRTRFHSLGSSVVLRTTSKNTERPAQVRSASASESPLQDSDLLKDASLFPMSCPDSEEMHEPPLLAPPNTTTGSIAIRAMRSMRSVARLANWTNVKPMEKDTTLSVPPVKKHKQPVDVKKSKKTEKRKCDSSGDQMTLRIPAGSSEGCVAVNNDIPPVQASTTRKHGVLGLGFPSSFRFGTVRSSSAGSCSQTATGFNNTSFDSRGRSSSTVSATSSLNPTTVKSRISSSSASVKWVEGRMETVKMACRRERVTEQREESHKEARPKGAIVDIFPEHSSGPVSSMPTSSAPRPVLVTKATPEGVHFVPGSESMATPRKQTRVRPASDQMTDKERLMCIRHDPDGELRTIRK